MTLLFQLILNGIVNAAVFSLLAIGFGLVYRSMRFFHIAFGGVYILAPFAMIACSGFVRLPFAMIIMAGLLAAVAAGVAMDRLVYFPFETKNASSGVLFIASLGIYILIVNIVALFFGNEIQILSKKIDPSFSLGPLVLTRMQAVQFLAGWSVVLIFWSIIRKSNLMKAIWAMGEAPELVAVLGLPYKLMRTIVFTLSSLFAGLAAILTSLDIGVDPHVGMQALLTGAVAVLIGGVDVYWGWIGGAVLIATLQSIAVWQFSARWNDLITFGLLIIALLLRPQGLFSPKKRREERQ